MTAPYVQLPGGPDLATYSGRLTTCQTCQYRVGPTCKPSQQLTSILARLPLARCPAAKWADQTIAAPSRQPAYTYTMSTQRVSVAVVCHNQGQFLREALDSVDRQTTPAAERLLIDNASTDNTAEISAQYPAWKYLRRQDANLARARFDAYQHTTGEFLVTLDADDVLSPNYLEKGVTTLDAHQRAAICWTDLAQFGDVHGRLQLTPANINRTNWIHSGSVVRRAALDQLDPAEAWPCDWNPLAHHDWRLWRTIMKRGWTAADSPAVYHYRRHADSLTATQRRDHTPWPILADLYHEPVTLFIPASGRLQLLDRLPGILADAAHHHGGPLSLKLAVTTDDTGFLARLCALAGNALALGRIKTYTLSRQTVGPEHLADADRHNSSTHRDVQIAMARLYSKALAEADTEYNWILEDDIGPPPDALPALLASFDHNVASVGLPYASRFQAAYVAWTADGNPYTTPPRPGPSPVGGNGFGCTMLRRSFFQDIPIRSDRRGDYDPSFYSDLARQGGIAIVDWSHPCLHG